ncbi:MAG: (Fe-S)-binding protein, partial [Saprospiraceae bacterium]
TSYIPLKNEYPDLGGHCEVIHHTQLIDSLIKSGKITIAKNAEKTAITYHDSCYLGRVNGIYEVPRDVLAALNVDLKEMPRHGNNGLCCGAGGAQMFKEDEPGFKRINTERVEEAISTGSKTVVSNCPFCLTMLSDGVREANKQDEMVVYDLSEMVLKHMNNPL